MYNKKNNLLSNYVNVFKICSQLFYEIHMSILYVHVFVVLSRNSNSLKITTLADFKIKLVYLI